MQRLVIIESPYAGDIERNLRYCRAACYHATLQGDVPFASHLFFTQFLDDADPAQRELGINLGFDFWNRADLVLFYVDLGMSPGMKDALAKVVLEDKPYLVRRIEGTSPGPQTDFVQTEDRASDILYNLEHALTDTTQP